MAKTLVDRGNAGNIPAHYYYKWHAIVQKVAETNTGTLGIGILTFLNFLGWMKL